MSKLFDLTAKVAIVTGASSGLGIQFAKALAREGADLVIAARRYDKLKGVSKMIEKETGQKCLPVACDVTDEADIKNCVEKAIAEYGKIDILVNNAGVSAGKEAENLSKDDWDWVIDVNLTGVFIFCKQVAKQMIKQGGGKIVNIASMYGQVGNDSMPATPYHASKGGVVNLTRALAGEWAKYNINVNSIGPGFFASEMTEDIIDDEGFLKYLKSRCPMKRPGKPGELDGTLVLLASDAANYITGQTLNVDGGWTAV